MEILRKGDELRSQVARQSIGGSSDPPTLLSSTSDLRLAS